MLGYLWARLQRIMLATPPFIRRLVRVNCCALRLSLGLLLAGCATVNTRQVEEGYLCTSVDQGSFGVVSTEFELPKRGARRLGYVKWDAGDGTFANPWITGTWHSIDGRSFDIREGQVNIMRHIFDARGQIIPHRLSLQLRASEHLPRFSRSVAASAYEGPSGPHHYRGDWTEVEALGRGSPTLHLIAIDEKRRIWDQAPVNGAIFARATPHIEAALRRAEQMFLEPEKYCEFVEDLRADDLVVTTGPQAKRSISDE